MKEEQERSRITAIRNRRIKAVESALLLVPVVEQARAELGRDITLRALADWLNARNYKTTKNKVWRAQTVSNLLSVDDLLIRDCEADHARVIAVESELCKRRMSRGEDRKTVMEARDRAIADSARRCEVARREACEIGRKIRGT